MDQSQVAPVVGTGLTAEQAVEEAMYVASRIAARRGLVVVSTTVESCEVPFVGAWGFRAVIRATFAVA